MTGTTLLTYNLVFLISLFEHIEQLKNVLSKIQSVIFRNLAVNACLMSACALHGQAVTTVEGLGSVDTKLHPVQVLE